MLYQEYIPRRGLASGPQNSSHGNRQEIAARKTFRDEVSSSEVDTRHQAVLSRFRTDIRARTIPWYGTAYVHWIRRFVTFRSLKSPSELGPEAVKEYRSFGSDALWQLSPDGQIAVWECIRLLECVHLRVKEMDFAQNQIVYGKGKAEGPYLSCRRPFRSTRGSYDIRTV